jgi:nicotinate-nucleotide adenylyltransferase
MCRLAFSIFGNAVEISDIEKALPSPSYTVNTVTALADMYPDRHLRLVIGSDIPAETDRWKEFDTIERLARPVVINRSGFPKHSEGPVFPEVSSTDIRHRLECGLDCRGLVPTGVLEYITRRGLYVDRGV